MIVLDLPQQTPAWHAWRAGRLGGSDAPAIAGVSPYSTRQQLLREKLGLEKREVSFAMRQGLMAEETARLMHQERVGLLFTPVCVDHDEIPWLAASLDGWNEDARVILEIKRPNWRDHDYALCGRVPPHYWPQVQHQLFVTGGEECHYVSYSPTQRFAGREYALVRVRPDAEYLAWLLGEEETFWDELRTKRGAA